MSDLRCPFSGHGAAVTPASRSGNEQWWPDQIDLSLLHQHNPAANPLGSDFNYREAFRQLDLGAVKADLHRLMHESQPWWPADWGHYGPLMIRLAWHSAGTYRLSDGRGGAGHGNQRFAPLNSWPDNTNLDKARRLLWPIKARYGNSLSWADLIILSGNVALESMGCHTMGFAGGRDDLWEPERDIFWGHETQWLSAERTNADGTLQAPLAASEMGLIYVNPEGPHGQPDPLASGRDVRDTFSRMGMSHEETVALVAGGHTFGKAHGAAPSSHLGAEPEAAAIEQQGLGWHSNHRSGVGADAITSGMEGAWKPNPTQWDQGYFEMLFGYDWELSKSPAGAWQWHPINVKPEHLIPDAHIPGRSAPPMMTTADLSLRFDPILEPIARQFQRNPQAFAEVFAQAWFKLTHRDLGPRSCYLGTEIPPSFSWQDPLPESTTQSLDPAGLQAVKTAVLNCGASTKELIETAWASASTYRNSDRRGGANGARIRLQPQNGWEVNQPEQLLRVLTALERQQHSSGLSLADLIVLAGTAAVESSLAEAGHPQELPFSPGRVDAQPEDCDITVMHALRPLADGFRNYCRKGLGLKPEHLLIDKAQQLSLSAPELTALIGGLRSLGIGQNVASNPLGGEAHHFSNSFFVNLLSMRAQWSAVEGEENLFVGHDRNSGAVLWHATRVDLVFGSHAQLRAIAEIYAQHDGAALLARDFAKAWVKVMNLDRFDLL